MISSRILLNLDKIKFKDYLLKKKKKKRLVFRERKKLRFDLGFSVSIFSFMRYIYGKDICDDIYCN